MTTKLKIGLVGTGQLSFPGPKEQAYARSRKELAVHAKEMGFHLAAYEPLVITCEDAEKARAFFEEQQVDFLLINTVSFSAGALVPVLAATRGARIGVWGIPEGQSTGVVPFNSFCGVNLYVSVIKRYLKNFHVLCKWFYGYGDSPAFAARLNATVTALSAYKRLCQSRIALVGGIAPGFNDLYFDERDINSLFPGISVNRLHEFSEISALADAVPEAEAAPVAERILKGGRACDPKSKDLILLSAKLYLAYRQFVQNNRYDALALSCWPKFQDVYRYSVCSVVAMLNDDGIPVSCEGDLPSALNMLALAEMTKSPAMLMDLSAFDPADDTVLMWHCGPASCRFCSENGYSLGVNYHGLPHEPGKGVNSCGVTRDMEFDPQPVTVFRFSEDFKRYFLLEGEFLGRGKDSFHGSRGWLGKLRFDGTDIGAQDLVETILSTGFEHHYPIAAGSLGDAIKEFAGWLGLPSVERKAYQNYLQQ